MREEKILKKNVRKWLAIILALLMAVETSAVNVGATERTEQSRTESSTDIEVQKELMNLAVKMVKSTYYQDLLELEAEEGIEKTKSALRHFNAMSPAERNDYLSSLAFKLYANLLVVPFVISALSATAAASLLLGSSTARYLESTLLPYAIGALILLMMPLASVIGQTNQSTEKESSQIARVPEKKTEEKSDSNYSKDYQFQRSIFRMFPDHWAEVTRPSDDVKKEIEKRNSIYKDSTPYVDRFLYTPAGSYISSDNAMQKTTGNNTIQFSNNGAVSFILRVSVAYNGYAILCFEVYNSGQKPVTITGLSKIEIRNKENISTAGGYTGETKPQRFHKPISLNPGESDYMAIVFDPATWYSINWSQGSATPNYGIYSELIDHPYQK